MREVMITRKQGRNMYCLNSVVSMLYDSHSFDTFVVTQWDAACQDYTQQVKTAIGLCLEDTELTSTLPTSAWTRKTNIWIRPFHVHAFRSGITRLKQSTFDRDMKTDTGRYRTVIITFLPGGKQEETQINERTDFWSPTSNNTRRQRYETVYYQITEKKKTVNASASALLRIKVNRNEE